MLGASEVRRKLIFLMRDKKGEKAGLDAEGWGKKINFHGCRIQRALVPASRATSPVGREHRGRPRSRIVLQALR